MHCLKYGWMLFALMALNACSNIENVTGSFEESNLSGRLFLLTDDAPDLNQFRYFRLHLRQFETEIGGTFETFDLSSFDAFSQLPVIIQNAMSAYYCARIDYGYVRNDVVYVFFTDREQRRWVFKSKLGQQMLSGALMRVHANGNDFLTYPEVSLMPEDRAYYERGGAPETEMVFDLMDDHGSESLACLHYYRATHVDFVLPDDLMERCADKWCSNLRLAVVGAEPHSKALVSEMPAMLEILSAGLESVDVRNHIRTVVLRDDPHAELRSDKGFFMAAAFVYDDISGDGHWNAEEPVYAALTNNLFLFYDDKTTPSFYGSLPDGIASHKTEQRVTINEENFKDQRSGWIACEDISVTQDDAYWRVPVSVYPSSKSMILRSMLPRYPDGCQLRESTASADNESLPVCAGIFPLLLM